MNPAVVFLISEGIKVLVAHIASRGSLNNLTQVEAEAQVEKLAAALPSVLPSPEELENPPNPA